MKKLFYVSYGICLNISFFSISQESELSLQLVLEPVAAIMSKAALDEVDLRCTEILTSESDNDDDHLETKRSKKEVDKISYLCGYKIKRFKEEGMFRNNLEEAFDEICRQILRQEEMRPKEKYTVDIEALRLQRDACSRHREKYINAEENVGSGDVLCQIVDSAGNMCNKKLNLSRLKRHVMLCHIAYRPYICTLCLCIFALPSRAGACHEKHRHGKIRKNYSMKDVR